MEFTREDVEFDSHAATLRGWLYRPVGVSAPSPAVVLTHGFSAVREMFLDRYGEAFAAAGIAALVYDHFGFGASDGEPRQCVMSSRQRDGYRDAITWLRAQEAIDPDRIGIWGSSFSGGHVVVLAADEDLPIRCAVAQVPVIARPTPSSQATMDFIGQAMQEGRLDDMVPVTSSTPDGLGIMFHDGAYDWFTAVAAERAPSWRNEVRIGGFAERPAQAIDHLADVRVPLLLIVAPGDTLTPPDAAIAVASAVDLVEIVEIPGGHFDAYESEFTASSEPAVAWFQRHLTA